MTTVPSPSQPAETGAGVWTDERRSDAKRARIARREDVGSRAGLRERPEAGQWGRDPGTGVWTDERRSDAKRARIARREDGG
jgi:hypothetical protein